MVQKKAAIFANRRLEVILHVLAWVIIILIPRFIINTYGDGNDQHLFHLYVNITLYGLLFYLNYFFLVPNVFLKGKKFNYVIFSAGILVLFCAVMWYLDQYLMFDQERAREMTKIFDKNKELFKPPIREFKIVDLSYTSILIWGFAFGLKLLEKVISDEKERKDLEKEKKNAELAFLKNQISPHFFFNTLNNIYSLIRINADDAQESVLKLSKMMRYLLYDSEKGETKLEEEISFLNNYISLMKLRLNEKVKLSLALPENYTDHSIPPLLFVPFVENAFKHGVSYRKDSFIRIKMEVTENRILFNAQNSIFKEADYAPFKHSGIGLENVKKRLELLFPGTHQLEIIENDVFFSVNLVLNLN